MYKKLVLMMKVNRTMTHVLSRYEMKWNIHVVEDMHRNRNRNIYVSAI